MIVLSTLLMPAMIIRSYQGWLQMLLIDFPLFMASTMSVSSFYLVSQKELFPGRWYKTFLYIPFLMALGVGLTITNTKAVLEALFGIKSAFARTPKYRVQVKGERSAGKGLSEASWNRSMDRTRHRLLLLGYCLVRDRQRKLLHCSLPSSLCLRLLVHRSAQSVCRAASNAARAKSMHEKPYPVGV